MQRRWWGAGGDRSPCGHVLSKARLSNASRRVSIAGKCRPLAGCKTSIGPSDTWGQQGKPVSPGGWFHRAALPGFWWMGSAELAGARPMAPPRPHALQEVNAVNAGGSHHPPGERSLGSASGHSHTESQSVRWWDQGVHPTAYFTPLGPLRQVGPPQGGRWATCILGLATECRRISTDTRVPARMPYWTSQKQSRNVTQRGNRSSPGRGGPAERRTLVGEPSS